jgi:16S rRNA (cytosine967-C5)-methyltransferase
VNAVLRRFQRERDAVLHAVDATSRCARSHPRWLVEALRRDHGHERALAALEAGNAHPPLWLRVNRRRWSVDRATEQLVATGFTVDRHSFAPDAIKISPPTDVDRCRDSWTGGFRCRTPPRNSRLSCSGRSRVNGS